jgi:hypothetical protein
VNPTCVAIQGALRQDIHYDAPKKGALHGGTDVRQLRREAGRLWRQDLFQRSLHLQQLRVRTLTLPLMWSYPTVSRNPTAKVISRHP